MTIRLGIWAVDSNNPTELRRGQLPGPNPEKVLEDMIVARPSMLHPDWMLIGRQVRTASGGIIDLLAIAPDGSLVVIELKQGRTPRDVVAQAIDYASWAKDLTATELGPIYQKFKGANADLWDDFKTRFSSVPDEDAVNESHQIVIVASELDASTERIVTYLNERDIAINTLFFQIFNLGEQQIITRHWQVDPTETQVAAATATKSNDEPWNGEYYVSFGEESGVRSWDDAREFGFVSAGGGTWYSQTLKLLKPGDRVWVRIPQVGYVGCGEVTGTVLPAKEFTVTFPDGDRPLRNGSARAPYVHGAEETEDTEEYVVAVRWLHSRPASNALHEPGLFGNQNTVCRPTAAKWRHTVERLKEEFRIERG